MTMLPVIFQVPKRSLGYFHKDMFATARSAGAVDGTASEPGPGTREAIDLDSRISIASGAVAVAAGGSSAWDRTGLWLTPALTRVAGQVLAFDLNISAISTMQIGATTIQDANFTGHNNVSLFLEAGSTFLKARRSSAATSPEIFVPATGTLYRFYMVLRATGRYVFVKPSGGSVKFLWSDAWDSTASLYIGFAVNNLNCAFSYDNPMSLSSIRYTVQASSSDSFNRADGTVGNTDGLGHAEANSGSGLAWSDRVGAFAISSNKLAASSLSGGVGIATVTLPNVDQVIMAEIVRSGGNVGIAGRYSDSSNYVYAYHDGTNVALKQVVAGVTTDIVAATAVTYSAGARIQISFDGAEAWLFYNDDYVGKGSVNAALTGVQFGAYTTNTGNTLENWRSFERNGYSDLGAY